MLALSALTFQTPLALAALALLPVIWWLLRITPPRPQTVRFPAIRFLLKLKDRMTTSDKSPWWLTALRIALAAILIIALAGPTLNPSAKLTAGSGRLLVILDDGWASSKHWADRLAALDGVLADAARAGAPVVLATTAPAIAAVKLEPRAATSLREQVKTLTPRPQTPDRKGLAARLEAAAQALNPSAVIWLSDGLDYGHAESFAATLITLANGASNLTMLRPEPRAAPLRVPPPTLKDGKLTAHIARIETTGTRAGLMRALAENGRTLADLPFTIAPGQARADLKLDLPLAVRNRIARLEIDGAKSPAGVFLLDDRWRRKAVGLATSNVRDAAQPLLSATHYVRAALAPKAALRLAKPAKGASGITDLLQTGLSLLVLADIGKLQRDDAARVHDWVEKGGILLRFAGARLAGGSDALVPVKLRRGDRALGGALSWTKPQKLAPFDATSPFFGMTPPEEVSVKRQVLADPAGLTEASVWARLEDGTPLVTAARRGAGFTVLFHVPSSPGWSNLPLSGLFVQMLHKVVDMAPVLVGSGTTRDAAASPREGLKLNPRKMLNGFGDLENPARHVEPATAATIRDVAISPRHPPGLYGPENGARALNIGAQKRAIKLAGTAPPGAVNRVYGPVEIIDLKPSLLIAAMLLFLADALAVFFLSGAFAAMSLRPRSGVAALMIAAALGLGAISDGVAQTPAAPGDAPGRAPPPPAFSPTPERARPPAAQPRAPASAEERFAINATQQTRLAYVLTGNANLDTVSAAGLLGLSTVLKDRTAFEPGPPIGINIERDELTFFPLVYWPVSRDQRVPSPKAMAKIDTYMKRGGTILFDTQDHQSALPGTPGVAVSPNTARLRQILSKLDIPPLEPVPVNHVLTKAFYLQREFPGRWAGGRLWVEAAPKPQNGEVTATTKGHDGVTSIIVGANNYAAAWARNAQGQAMLPVVPGGARQREMAYRTGINIVMHVLTGNYKADQVHVPSLLERLGQ